MKADSGRDLLAMPEGFLWGAATAAHQNEGQNLNNQWARWEAESGRIFGGHTCGKATNWWDLDTAQEDFSRARDLGMNSLRVSVEWSRIEPEEGQFRPDVLRHYAEMMRRMRAAGLEPMVTLHHFTDPLWMTAQGAWENPRCVEWFARFTTRVVEALADQVDFWCTINEPFVYAHQGFLAGIFPPGAQSLRRTVRVVKNMLLAHGRSYRIIHRLQNNARAGTAHNLQLMIPDNPDNPLDRYAAAVLHQVANRTTLEAVVHGRLTPLIGYGQLVPQLLDSSDYIGLNYYTTVRAAFDLRSPAALFTRRFFGPDAELTDLTRGGYAYSQYDPEGMYLALKTVAEYGKPIYITENGIPDHDDDMRPRFLVTYLAEAWRAIQEGVPLKGYYHWTLIDNFEWCEGWNLKFGLFEIDHETGQRTPKHSAEVFREIATSNGLPRSLLAEVAPGFVVNAG